MVMKDCDKPRDTHMLARGDYRNMGEKVSPAFLLSCRRCRRMLRRIVSGLRKWLVDPAHPLTARVAVNRYWQMYFGNGIVKTVEDFGSQGESPVHRGTARLAGDRVCSHWLGHKGDAALIVTSAAYRQSSKVDARLLEKDPENRLLARGPRVRLPAEMIRDSALAASGLLERKSAVRACYPYSPKGIWEDIAYGGIFSAQIYPESEAEDLYIAAACTRSGSVPPPPAL